MSASRLPLINENEVQGKDNVLVQSPLKLTPILGTPTPSQPSEVSGDETISEQDNSCFQLRRFKRKSTLPLPPNTVIYCSYA